MTFEYRDDHQLTLRITRLEPDYPGQTITPAIWIETSDGFFSRTAVKVPADRVEEVVAGIRDAARAAARTCNCPHPVDEHSIYGCADDCACEWMPNRATRQTTGQDDTWPLTTPCGYCSHTLNWHVTGGRCRVTAGENGCGCTTFVAPDGSHPDHPDRAPAVGQPAEAHDTEARPPRVQWRVEGYDADVWLPVSRSFASSADAHARKRVSKRYPDMPTRVVRETTTWTVEGER